MVTPSATPSTSSDATGTTISRRSALIGTGVTAGVAWVAPTIISAPAAAAATMLLFRAVLIAGGGGTFVAFDSSGNVSRSTDGGDTWGPGQSVGVAPTLAAGSFFFIAEAGGNYARSTNTGQSWAPPTTPPSFTATKISQDGAIVGLGNSYEAGTAGNLNAYAAPTTAPTAFPNPSLLSGVNNNGVIVGRDGAGDIAVELTTDGGDTWTSATTPPAVSGEDPVLLIGSPSGSTVWFATAGWFVSNDGGDTWAAPTTPPPGAFTPVLLSGSNVALVAIDAAGTVYRSTDDGDTWALGGAIGFVPTMLAGFAGTDFVVTDGAGSWAVSSDTGATWAAPTTPPAL